MKINSLHFNNFINNLPPNLKAILLFGADTGLVYEFSSKIKQTFIANNSSEQITVFDANDIKKNPVLLQEAIFSVNLFSNNNKKLLIINNCNSYLTPIIKDLLPQITSETLLILLSEELPFNNTLRILCEKEHDTAAIACYHDTEASLTTFIKQFLSRENFSLSSEALQYLVANLGNDRLITQKELEKLILYMGDNKNITIKEVTKVVNNSTDLALTNLIYDITLGNQIAVYKSLHYYLISYPAIMVVRTLGNSFKKLLLAKCLEKENLSLNEIAKKVNPPVLFLHIPQFKKQLSLWNINLINTYLKKIINLELNIKKNPALGEVLINKLTLDIHLLLNRKCFT